MYICENGTWRDGGRLRTSTTHPQVSWCLATVTQGHGEIIGGDMEQLPHQTEHIQTTGYIIDCVVLILSASW
jgi:hypothetical protein